MKRVKRIKLVCAVVFASLALVLLLDKDNVVREVGAFSTGPPPGHTGGPGEQNCNFCHVGSPVGGQFQIIAPQTYTPGNTYQVTVRHINVNASRQRWGFQIMALAGNSPAGALGVTNGVTTQIVTGAGEREYMEHTADGTFFGTTGGAQWQFNWTAPSTAVGPVTFYAAGNQANGDGTASNDWIYNTTATLQPAMPDPVSAPFDFDDDGKTDVGIFRPSVAEWWISRSSNSQVFAAQFGQPTDIITPGDYTGDGKSDIAFWRPSTGFWFVLRSEDFSFFAVPFGASTDIPAAGDYDGDGRWDTAIFRPSETNWYINRSTQGVQIVQFGATGDRPIPNAFVH